MSYKINSKINASESNEYYIGLRMCGIYPIEMSLYRKKSTFPGSLTDLHRFRKTAHGHDGSSRIIMVRKTDQRTYASIENGQVSKPLFIFSWKIAKKSDIGLYSGFNTMWIMFLFTAFIKYSTQLSFVHFLEKSSLCPLLFIIHSA